MIIRRLYIQGFGRFREKRIEFAPGINIIYGENESGKSTLHAFVQGMLFGIRRMRGRASRPDRYTRYEPWDNPGQYEGQMWFSCGDKEFRLHRVFQKDRQNVELLCETDGELLSVQHGDLDVLLGNVNEVIYQNTVSVGQLKSKTEEGLGVQLRDYMSNYQGSLDARLSVDGALENLKKRKRELEKREREEQEKQREALQRLEGQAGYVREEILRLKEREREILEHRGADPSSGWKKKAAYAVIVGNVLLLILMAAGICPWPAGGIALLVLDGLYGVWRLAGKREDPADWEREQIQLEKSERQAVLANLEEEYREQLEEDEKKREIKEDLQAVELAAEIIGKLSVQMQKDIGLRLRERMREILSRITEGKYSHIFFEEDFRLRLDTGERYLSLEQLSRGTMEQIYFAFRMAAGEVLCEEESMPVLTDDTFVMYDERRLEQVLRWLAEEREQILIFTCQKREERLLQKMGISYHYITL